ncbi:MAG TPA: hypothetical protein VNO33_24245, partial [Kofleriaceae bacterium]|nr:hypothetical protein [Kofleriaceae bacterium]
MSGRALSLLAIAIALLASPGPLAAAPDPAALVSQARQAMTQLNYERAIQLLERAEESGENRREQLITIYRWLAESRAAMGHAEAAESEFRRLLALDPDAALPRGSSPKYTDPLEAARDFMRQRQPLAVRCERREDGAVLVVLSDPVDLVAAARPTRASGEELARAATRSGRGRIALALPAGAPRELACTALDRHGNELARAPLAAAASGDGPDPYGILAPGERERAGRSSEVTVSRERDEPAPPIYARWWLWGAGAAIAAGTGAYFAVQLQADEDD